MSTERTSWTLKAECPNNGDCESIKEHPDGPDNPDDCEHLTLEASATNSELSAEQAIPIKRCQICKTELEFSKRCAND